jgi:hypothetical protein
MNGLMGSDGSALDKGEGPVDGGINQPNRPFVVVSSLKVGKEGYRVRVNEVARQDAAAFWSAFIGYHD